MSEIEFTSEQAECLRRMKEFTDCSKQVFRLSGYSGTGKSFVTGKFIEWYCSEFPDKSIAAIAPSHKAKKNLALMVPPNVTVDIATIASFLGLTPQMQASGEQVFTESEELTSSEEYDLAICDEYSMVDKKTVLSLLSKCKKIIFVGDPAQLPPIGESLSYVCELKCHQFQLTKVVRYSGDLARIAESWRSDIIVEYDNGKGIASLPNPIKPLAIETTEDGSIVRLSKVDWIERYACEVKQAISTGNYYHCKIITFTNKCANKWNSWVRSEIWENDEPYCIGDRLLCKKPLFRPIFRGKSSKLEIVVPNSTEFTVIGVATLFNRELCGDTYEYHSVPCKDDEGAEISLFILTPESSIKLNQAITALKREGQLTADDKYRKKCWNDFYYLSQVFDEVSFAYAITTHKSQGSTYDMVFADLTDMRKCQDYKKIIYTGLTRAKKALTFA